MSYRADKPEGQGGGVLILVSRAFQVSRVVSSLGHRREVWFCTLSRARWQSVAYMPPWSCDQWGAVLVFRWDAAI